MKQGDTWGCLIEKAFYQILHGARGVILTDTCEKGMGTERKAGAKALRSIKKSALFKELQA